MIKEETQRLKLLKKFQLKLLNNFTLSLTTFI